MGLFTGLDIAASALSAQRLRMDVIASNIANAEVTRTPEGGPYRRAAVVFAPLALARSAPSDEPPFQRAAFAAASTGVAVQRIVQDPSEPRLAYEPGHPDADENGYVAYPNVDLVTEMTDLLSATRAYEANVTIINSAKAMAQRALEIGRG
jgi:flagellar basal-body rod protein FlgC